jgi:site-specific recombinase XerD
MAHHTLIARINAGGGKFPYLNVQFSKNHRPIPIEGATYYLRPGKRGRRTPIRIRKDLNAAFAALLNMEDCKGSDNIAVWPTVRASVVPATVLRKTIAEAAQEYIERSSQKSRKTLIGYRTAVNLFVQNCSKTDFDEIRRDDMLDYLYFLRNCKSSKTGGRFGESTVFNYFLKTMVFLNDRGIAKYVAKEDWVQKKDWPINVDKRNKNKKYATYLEEEIAAMLQVANGTEEALIRFLLGLVSASARPRSPSGWTPTGRIKPSRFGSSRSSDSNRRTMKSAPSWSATRFSLALKKYRGSAAEDALIFPSPTTGTVDKHLDRVIHCVIDKANQAGYPVKKPKKPCHVFRVLYATRRHQNGVDIETLRQELGHSDISTTQIYLRSADRKSDKHRARINEADKFSLLPAGVLFVRRRAS